MHAGDGWAAEGACGVAGIGHATGGNRDDSKVQGGRHPLEITRLTNAPELTGVPAGGFVLITLPAAMVLLGAVVTEPKPKPAVWKAESATASV